MNQKAIAIRNDSAVGMPGSKWVAIYAEGDQTPLRIELTGDVREFFRIFGKGRSNPTKIYGLISDGPTGATISLWRDGR